MYQKTCSKQHGLNQRKDLDEKEVSDSEVDTKHDGLLVEKIL